MIFDWAQKALTLQFKATASFCLVLAEVCDTQKQDLSSLGLSIEEENRVIHTCEQCLPIAFYFNQRSLLSTKANSFSV